MSDRKQTPPSTACLRNRPLSAAVAQAKHSPDAHSPTKTGEIKGTARRWVRTAGEELRLGRDHLALKRLRVRAPGALHGDAALLDPPRQPQKVAVAQQVRRLELPVSNTRLQRHRNRVLGRLDVALGVVTVTYRDLRDTKLSKVP